MKKIFYYFSSLFLCCFLSMSALNAQTCNDPNAYNTGQMGTCQTCFDFVQNGDETGVDCGGSYPGCATCPPDIHLEVDGISKLNGEVEIIGEGFQEVGGFLAGQLQVKSSGTSSNAGALISGHNSENENSQLWYLGSANNTGNQSIALINRKNDNIFLGTNDITRMTIHRDGDVGIGTSFPSEKLHVVGNKVRIASVSSSSKYLEFKTDGNELDIGSFGGKLFLTGNNAQGVIIQQGTGNVGIGNDTSPDYKLEVNGSVGKPGGGSWINSSDKRLKKDIKDFNYGLELVEKVHPIFYHYNGKENLPTDEEYVGVIAQELQKIAPFMVSEFEGEEGQTYLAVDPSAFDYILINAVKEVKQEKDEEIDDLKKEIQTQQQQINDLQKMVEALVTDKTTESNLSTENRIISKEDFLFQNQPNPFSNITTIQYNIPKTTNQATIHITNLSGKILQSYPINGTGTGNITVQGSTFAAGIYMYSLDLDGELVATKKMVLTK